MNACKCTACGCPLTGKVDTYGPHDQPFCWWCWQDVTGQDTEDMYGVSPHIHDLSKTGSYIGSTVRLELPQHKPGEWIDLAPLGDWYVNWMFKEDPEAPGLGTYVHKSNFGGDR